ncbi:hypothetical protein LHU53_12880 [Rhodoferax sp. U2-2l]|uniref:hypothetical protein n=1 Tax=Rhodoferax sp. U2-2l TaxID=2884000 RepID=UPI001D0ABB8E|nr:hypothetical protein [Rhodoferax sp. U2-2l]MCB8747798.1 hypothetical protein [Rhodoferax sp. U2-2l]
MLIRVVLIDENSGRLIFRAEAAATWTEHEIPTDELPTPETIQVGELKQLLDSPTLEGVFLTALDDAYTRTEQSIVPIEGEVVSLAIKEGVL